MKYFAILAPLIMLAAPGCSDQDGEDDDLKGAPVAFKGEPQARFAGKWKTGDGVSTYELNRDGTYALDSKIKVQGQGTIDSHLKGEWRVDEGKLLFKDERGDVVPYAFKLDGDDLELSLTGRMKSKTVLKRQ